jgi:hypothetical protein
MCFSAQERRAFRRLRQALESSNARIERFMNAWHTVRGIIQHSLTFSVSLAADCSDHYAHAVTNLIAVKLSEHLNLVDYHCLYVVNALNENEVMWQ